MALHSRHTDQPAYYRLASSMAHEAGLNHFQAVSYKHGFLMALRGGVPCNLDWLRANYPEETRVFELGFQRAIEQMKEAA